MSKFNLAPRIVRELTALIARGKRRDGLENYLALREAIERNQHLSELVRSVTDLSDFHPITRGDMERGRRRLTDHLAQRRRRRRRAGYAAAAACAALLAVAGVWLTVGRDGEQVVVVAGNIPSERVDVPVVVLSSGERVELSAAALIADGTSNIDNRDTVLVYGRGETAEDPRLNRIITPARSRYTVVLSDGTQVTLNANSEIEYQVGFGAGERRVSIRGQAFFSVEKDARPFVVNADGVRIEVFGTSFDVNAHAAGEVTATLVDGSIGLTHGGRSVTLTPGHTARVELLGGGIDVAVADTRRATMWMGDSFSYDNVPLEVLLGDIAAWYGLEFRYSPQAVENVMVTVHMARTHGAERIMDNLGTLLGVKFVKMEGNAYGIVTQQLS